ncbi:MAG: hypothetical protein WCA15_09070 [Candidatus Acidiferrales bacterium]
MNLVFFRLPLSTLTTPKFLGDLAIQLVEVSLIEAITNGSQALLQSLLLLLFKPRLAASARQQRLFKLGQNTIRDVNILQNLAEPLTQFLLSKIGELALAARPRATVVGVFRLFNFRSDQALVIRALQ